MPEAKRPEVYYARGPQGLVTGLAGSINVEMIEFLGAKNVAGDQKGGLAQVGFEQVVLWDPPVIVTNDPNFYRDASRMPVWQSVTAVRKQARLPLAEPALRLVRLPAGRQPAHRAAVALGDPLPRASSATTTRRRSRASTSCSITASRRPRRSPPCSPNPASPRASRARVPRLSSGPCPAAPPARSSSPPSSPLVVALELLGGPLRGRARRRAEGPVGRALGRRKRAREERGGRGAAGARAARARRALAVGAALAARRRRLPEPLQEPARLARHPRRVGGLRARRRLAIFFAFPSSPSRGSRSPAASRRWRWCSPWATGCAAATRSSR